MSDKYDKLKDLLGLTVVKIMRSPDSDEGILIKFCDGSYICVGYSACEGSTELNGEILDD